MGFYNMLHGQNPDSALLLGALGLSEEQCGRFRDVWITPADEIAVYTRNGGGNRGCWHTDDPKWGSKGCKHHTFEEEVDEIVWEGDTIKTARKTGKRIMETRYVCESPDSIECACPGCTIGYRLPAHPLYLRDEDDDFDSTYATIYFRPPDSIPEDMPRGESGDDRWAATLAALQAASEAKH